MQLNFIISEEKIKQNQTDKGVYITQTKYILYTAIQFYLLRFISMFACYRPLKNMSDRGFIGEILLNRFESFLVALI